MIISTRETPQFRDEIIALGISQVSAGSCTGVGGYKEEYESDTPQDTPQFEVGDHRSPMEILKGLCKSGYIPSYCTACYRQGRTGERFITLAKAGEINNICLHNAILTFKEFLSIMRTMNSKISVYKQLPNLCKAYLKKLPVKRQKNISRDWRTAKETFIFKTILSKGEKINGKKNWYSSNYY